MYRFDMELIVSSGVHRGLICSPPLLSMLAKGRRFGGVSRTGTRNGGLWHRQEVRMWQTIFVSLYSKQVTVAQVAGQSPWAQVYSQQGGFSDVSNGKGADSALLQQNLQPTNASPETQDTSSSLEVLPPDLVQGTEEWLAIRKNRMTASSFGNALGFWGTRRVELWEQKIGIREPFAGNTATRWGSSAEAAAIEKYKDITGNSVDHTAFKIYQAGDDYLSWLGASPDGLITYNAEGEQSADDRLGILEVKCPHNKGKPELGSPWAAVPYYYMPQAQGLLEIFDRKQMDFYVWTMNGSSVFRIERNPEYWALMFRIMAEFWWGHVVPAKSALMKGKSIADIEAFRPVGDQPSAERLVSMSRHLAQNSRLIWRENMGHIQRF